MNRAWLSPLSFLYGIGVTLRHKMFDWGVLRSREYDIPIVCVGNLTVGGTGKTPVTEMLIRNLSPSFRIAVLSMGYRRRTKGYLEVGERMPFLDAGDEAKQVKLKFPDVVVAVCRKRAEGIEKIRERHPDVDLILMDDGFQHRYVEPWVNIILIDYTRPVYRDHLLPRGMLRDKVSQLYRANYILITKCPDDMSPLDRRLVRKYLKLYPYQHLYFCRTRSFAPVALYPREAVAAPAGGDGVVAMSGIGNPAAFLSMLEEQYTVHGVLEYPDHHPYRRRDLKDMETALREAPAGAVIMTTEKDAVKLRNGKKIPAAIRERLFYVPVRVVFEEGREEDFMNRLQNDLRTNPKDGLLAP